MPITKETFRTSIHDSPILADRRIKMVFGTTVRKDASSMTKKKETYTVN